jgi:hypothetical protein
VSRVFSRRFVLGNAVLVIAAIPSLLAQAASLRDGSPDPIFSTVPFEQWLTANNQARIRWTVRLSEPELSAHQRLAVNLDVQVDGAELARRRGEGQFLVFVQLSDEKNRTWQNHQALDLEQIQAGIKADNAVFTQPFFVLPGDYRVSVAIFDSATGEHSIARRNLHVTPLRNDPLPDMWRDLPAIEFVGPESSSSDRWFLPSIAGRLKLAVETRHPVNVDLLVNLTPSERFSASTRIQNRNLDALIPAARVLSQVEWHNAKFNLELLDLARRRVAYRQENMQALDWSKAGSALDKVNPGIIDVRSLANRRYSADFFLNRISRRITAPNETVRVPRVVIVLSSTVFFEPGVEMHPIRLASRPDVTVFYIRYHLRPVIFVDPTGRPRRVSAARADDELAPLLKPLAPRMFDVATPEQFRKTLALVLDRIAEL